MPPLHRALFHLAFARYDAEADSGSGVSSAARRCPILARAARHVDFLARRSRLEFSIKAGNAARAGFLMGPGGVGAWRWDLPSQLRGLPPVWNWALFARWGEAGTTAWPALSLPGGHAVARAQLCARVGGEPFMFDGYESFGPRVFGPLAAWRAAHLGALAANVSKRDDLVDADFAQLVGIKALNMWGCTNTSLTSAACARLRGVHTLWMGGCNQASLGDAALAHLRGVHTLSIAYCTQATLTDTAFVHLRGVHTLDMRCCSQPSITGATLSHLRGVRMLSMHGCQPAVIAAARALRLPVMW